MRPIVGQRVGEHPAGAGGRLESAVAPPAVHVEPFHRQLADDGTAVHGHVHDAAPGAHEPQAREEREQADGARHDVLDEGQVAALGVGVVTVEIATHQDLALVGLADIKMSGTGGDHGVEHGLQGLGHHGLQHVGLDGQAHVRHGREPARVSGHHDADLVGADVPAGGVDAHYPAAFAANPRHLTVLDDVDAARIGRAREAPGHRVVAGDAATRL